MPYCPECGKPVSRNARFCRNCGASQSDETSAPAPLPVPELLKSNTCISCGALLNPDEKFCGNCGASQSDETSGPVALPVPEPPKSRICTSCGTLLKADEKFCGNCGNPVSAPAAVPLPPPPASSSGRFCGSCGNPVSATTKFCGNCGNPVNVPAAPPQTLPPPTPQFYPPPGAPPGSTMAAVQPEIPLSRATPGTQNEELIGVIANAKKSKMLGAAWDTYNLVVTDRRMIVAQLTQPMMNAAIAQAQAKAKEQGKGFFGIVADQMSAMFQYAVRYESMAPDAILAETPGNFSLDNSIISVVDLSLRDHNGSSGYSEFKMVIKSPGGKFEYRIAEDDRYINILKAAYGERVSMPFGYHKIGGVRIKFF